MRFGISEISWMLPKILRIRRWLVRVPLELFRGAASALVAMCFPALRGTAEGRSRLSSPAEAGQKCGALVPVTLSNACGPCACIGPCPGEDGKSPGRTSPCGGAVYLLDRAHIILFPRMKRGEVATAATIFGALPDSCATAGRKAAKSTAERMSAFDPLQT